MSSEHRIIDLRTAYLRGLVAQRLARAVKHGADALVAVAYADAIARNAKLRGRFRRRGKTYGDDWPAWPRVARHHDRIRLEMWGGDFAHGREPSCYAYGAKLPIGKVEYARDRSFGRLACDVEQYLHDTRGDAPCCVCPSAVITRCLTHWSLFHNGAAGCFRCQGHAAAVGPGKWLVHGPLWEGRKTPGFAYQRAAATPTRAWWAKET